jgi:hypothetical protein
MKIYQIIFKFKKKTQQNLISAKKSFKIKIFVFKKIYSYNKMIYHKF